MVGKRGKIRRESLGISANSGGSYKRMGGRKKTAEGKMERAVATAGRYGNRSVSTADQGQDQGVGQARAATDGLTGCSRGVWGS